MNEANGTLDIIRPEGGYLRVITKKAAIVLAEVGYVTHQGVPPRESEKRPMIEVTIVPAFINEIALKYAGLHARCPLPSFEELRKIYSPLIEQVNKHKE